MVECVSVWGCRRFEALYRDAIVPLLRQLEFERHKLGKSPARHGTRVFMGRAGNDDGDRGDSHVDRAKGSNAKNMVNPSFTTRQDKGASLERGYNGLSEDSNSIYETDYASVCEEYDICKNPSIQFLWGALFKQIHYFVRVLGHSVMPTTMNKKYLCSGPAEGADVFQKPSSSSDYRDEDTDPNQLKEAIATYHPDLLRVSLDSSVVNEKSGNGPNGNGVYSNDLTRETLHKKQEENVSQINSNDAVLLRESYLIFLVDFLSSKINLRQVECLHLIAATIQALNNDIFPALNVEQCCVMMRAVGQVQQLAGGNIQSSLALSSLGVVVIEISSARFRREQLHYLLCLQELAMDLYPLDQAGVSDVKSAGFMSFTFFKKILASGFFHNAFEALKFLMLESTRQRAQFFANNGDQENDPLKFSEWMDRLWSRRLAEMLIRLLMLICARFHPPPLLLLNIMELLEGSGFEEQALRQIRDTVFSEEEHRCTASITSRDFDFAALQDKESGVLDVHRQDAWLAILSAADGSLNMTCLLTLLFLDIVDPAVEKWDVMADTGLLQESNVHDVRQECVRHSHWFCSGDDGSKESSQYSWLLKRSLDHDMKPFWMDTNSYGQLLSFAVSVGYVKPLDPRKLQLGLSPAWNVFTMLKENVLDRLGGSSALSKVTLHTVHSLLSQVLLPLNVQWSGHIMRLEKLARHSSLQNSRSKNSACINAASPFSSCMSLTAPSYLEPVIALVNRVCCLLPTSIPCYAPILFALVDSFPWLELTSMCSREFLCSTQDPPTAMAAKKNHMMTESIALGAELCEVNMNQKYVDEEIPSVTGVVCPVNSYEARGLWCAEGKSVTSQDPFITHNTEPFYRDYRNGEPQNDPMDLQMVRNDDFHFLLPLFVEVINLAATVCAMGHRATAIQLATKLTSQPSLLGFFIPHTANRLESLFMALESGLLQRQFVSMFQKRRSNYMLKLRTSENGGQSIASSASTVATAFFDEQADTEEDDKALQCMIDHTIASILSSTTAIFRFFVASMSPRLFLTRPAPTPLLPQIGLNAFTHAKLLNWSYNILNSHARSSLGMMGLNSILNGFHLLNLKACVLDALSGSFETKSSDAVRLLNTFVHLLPVIHEDLEYLKALATEEVFQKSSVDVSRFPSFSDENEPTLCIAAVPWPHDESKDITPKDIPLSRNKPHCSIKLSQDQQENDKLRAHPADLIKRLSSELLGRLSSSLLTYFTSIVFRMGYRNRYNTAIYEEDTQDDTVGDAPHYVKSPHVLDPAPKLPSNVKFYNRKPSSSTFPVHHSTSTLPTLTRYVVDHMIPLLQIQSCASNIPGEMAYSSDTYTKIQYLMPPGYYWKLATMIFKFLRCILRGPLPLLDRREIDFIAREPFGSHAGVQEGAAATAWLMRSFLTLDSKLLSTVVSVARIAWHHLLSPWDLCESFANISKLQCVEAVMDILVTLFQRDTIFLYWWRRLRRTAVSAQSSSTADWSFVSHMVPIHINFLGHSSMPPHSSTTRSWGHLVFLLEMLSTERYRCLRKLAIYLLHQVNQRSPASVASFLNLSSFHVETLQSTLAVMLRDIELEEHERWEYLDLLGLLPNSDFPIPNCPEVLLDSCFNEETSTCPSDDVSLETRLRDSLSVWSASGCLELSRFYQEIIPVDFPALTFHKIFLHSPNDNTNNQRVNTTYQNTENHTTFDDVKSSMGVLTNTLLYTRGDSSLIASNKTGLPLHHKLEKRMLIAEEIAVTACDAAAWNLASHTFDDIPSTYLLWVSSALWDLTPDLLPPLPFFVPHVGAKYVTHNSEQKIFSNTLFEEACGALWNPGKYRAPEATTPEKCVSPGILEDKPISLLAQIMYRGSSSGTSRFFALQFLIQGLKQALYQSPSLCNDGREMVPTVVQLLGFVRTADSLFFCKNTLSSSHHHYTTCLPLPFITSPFATTDKEENDEAGSPVLNHWMHTSMLILDSLALIVEDANVWINDLPMCSPQDSLLSLHRLSTSTIKPDVFVVNDALTNTESYLDVTHEIYEEAKTTLAALEIFILLLSNPRTADAMLYLLFVRLPHRHSILYQFMTTMWDTPPSILFSVRKLICSSWIHLMTLEAHLCANYLSQPVGEKPAWLVRNYHNYILDARLDALRNQCAQVTEGLWALMQAPLDTSTVTDTALLQTGFSQGIPTLLSCVLAHLCCAESLCVPQDTHIWRNVYTHVFKACSTFLGYISSCDWWYSSSCNDFSRQSIQEFVVSLLHPYQVLLAFKYSAADHSSLDLPNPLKALTDYNHRSLSVFMAQRTSARLAELFAAALELIVIDLRHTKAVSLEEPFTTGVSLLGSGLTLPLSRYSIHFMIWCQFGSMSNLQHTLSMCLTRCLDSLGSSAMKGQRSRYSLMSITGSLLNALLTLNTSRDAFDPLSVSSVVTTAFSGINNAPDSEELNLCLDRALLKQLLQKVIYLCVTGVKEEENRMAQGSTAIGNKPHEEDNVERALPSAPYGLDQVLRLRLYVAVQQLLKLAKLSCIGLDSTALLFGIDASLNVLEPFAKQLQRDLLLQEESPCAKSHVPHCTLILPTVRLLYCEDPKLLPKLFPGLTTYPAESCVPVLKILIEFGKLQTLCKVFSTPYSPYAEIAEPTVVCSNRLAGHALLPTPQWTSNSATLQTVQLWFSQVFHNRGAPISASPILGLSCKADVSSSAFTEELHLECPNALPTSCASLTVMRLALSLLHVLIKQPALCEALFASNIPLYPPSYMLTKATVKDLPLSAVCRAVLLIAPFFPRMNIPFPTTSFGFPSLVSTDQTRVLLNSVTRLKECLQEATFSPTVALLPTYMCVLNGVLTKLKHLQVYFTISTQKEDPHRSTDTVERASLYFFKWWLTRDHQFSSCFRCFTLEIDELRHMLTENPALSCMSRVYEAMLQSSTDDWCLQHDYSVTATLDMTENPSFSLSKENEPEKRHIDDVTAVGDALLCHRLLKHKFHHLSLILMLTSHTWLQLLIIVYDTLQMQAQEKDTGIPMTYMMDVKTPLFKIPYDDIFLTLQFQSVLTQSAVLMIQLSAFNNYTTANSAGTSLNKDVLRTLLSPFHLTACHLDMILPDPQLRQQFLVNSLHCIEREFFIAKALLHQEPIEANKEQQIREQLKRSLVERTQSLVVILNAALLGVLSIVPLDRKQVPQLIKDIESFLYIPRWARTQPAPRDKPAARCKERPGCSQELLLAFTVAFYMRVLELSSGLLITGIQTLIDSEHIPLSITNVSVKDGRAHEYDKLYFFSAENSLSASHFTPSSTIIPPHRAILRRLFSTSNWTLGSPLQAQAIHLCGRSCVALLRAREIAGFSSSNDDLNKNVDIPLATNLSNRLPLRLLKGSAKIVCTNALTLLKTFVDVAG